MANANLPALLGLGPVTREGVAYRLTEAIDPDAVGDLIRQPWCHRVDVSDGKPGAPKFRALCVIDGEPIIVTGEIGGR